MAWPGPAGGGQPAALYNPIDPKKDETVYAWDRDSETRADPLAANPERGVRVIEGPSITGDCYRMVDKPPFPTP